MTSFAHTVSAPLQKLLDRTEVQKKLFAKTYPELYTELLQSHLTLSTTVQDPQARQVVDASVSALTSFAQQVTAEEHAVVIEKAQAAAQLPPGKLDRESTLYLEEQLSELLGFLVTTEHDGHLLPFSHGTVAAAPHIQIAPTDSLEGHSPEYAGFTERRSFFGWLTTRQNSLEKVKQDESFGIALPILQLSEWTTAPHETIEWYVFRKMVVVNPMEQRAVVVRVIDTYTPVSAKYSFAALPEVIIQGKCWSPRTLGRVLLFFVVDPTDRIPVGPVSLSFSSRRT